MCSHRGVIAIVDADRPLCPCHGLPMWSNGKRRFVCRVKQADTKRVQRLRHPDTRSAQREREYRRSARKSFLGPNSEARNRRERRATSSRYAATRDLNLAVRNVRTSPSPIDRGPNLPPLCACHHEPMGSDGSGGWRCRIQARAVDRKSDHRLKATDYAKWREKASRSERRRRAAQKGVRSEPYTRQELFDRDGGLCRYCGEVVGPDWHIAHLVALARGGEDTLDNVAVACAECNIADGVGRLPVQLHLPRAA